MPTPTIEQQEITDTFVGGKNLVINAGAGAGKTSTLKMCAAATPKAKGLYIAYNKAIQVEAAASFPQNVTCKTAHALAFAAVGRRFFRRLKAPRMSSYLVAKLLHINEPVRVNDEVILAPQQLARVVMATVTGYTRSATRDIVHHNIAKLAGLDDADTMNALAEVVPPIAVKAWADLTNPNGKLPYSHDCYLKMWTLTNPQLSYDFVLLDEAQDSNPPIVEVFEGQRNTQKVMVGDEAQSIYGWRGAQNAMREFNGTRLTLSQSFRFGEAIAAEANQWLSILDAPLRLRGFELINSRITDLDEPEAILCRTNAEALVQAMSALEKGRQVALVGGGKAIRSLAEAALQLQAGRGCDHPELCGFQTWGMVQDYVRFEESGSDLAPMVNLIDTHGAEKIIDVADQLNREDRAELTLSTAHKAKGREWKRVKIAGDFTEPKPNDDGGRGKIRPDDAMLAYVTVTRAQHVLDRGGLAWVDRYRR
ncbi:UvrD-helicase domain-containing protein [Nonomuraea basaltis]|uniref:UvrD-helicase domain-containing protein n=1 Tax=Nonomuraea basaltis TaxID=2495887 RepID=UPI00110C5F52|nr:UvrD-helicase domain-containing protein [Nonomuraea basaltis]TMR89497.1 hypothetical protein EJK15_60475 [Nonomuraea basaltis]